MGDSVHHDIRIFGREELEKLEVKYGRVEEAFGRRPGPLQGCRAKDDYVSSDRL
jgi:hypothetical protein